jgi:3-oxoadipate enol-lactonase
MVEFIQVNGVSLCVKRSGSDRAPTVVLSNSLAADMSIWDAQVRELEHSFQVVRIDTRGHGGSSAQDGDYKLETLADDVLAVLAAFDIKRAHFIGLSLGGIIGQVLGAREGDRFDSLTLCATFAETDKGLWANRADAVRTSGIAPIIDGTIQRWFTPAFSSSSPKVIDDVSRMIAGTSVNGYAGCAGAIRDMDLTGVPEKIHVPTLLIAGSEDPSATPKAMKQLQKRIPGARYAEINDAAHLFTIEKPNEATALITDFLQNVQSSAEHVAANKDY